jgi:Protein of unknown function (DUF2723)
LGLSLRAIGSTWIATACLALYYVASMARDLSLYDSGELALAAVQLGLAHPPGQPLHTLIGFAFSRLPFVTPLVGVGLVSALPAALTLIPATSLGQRVLGERASGAARSGMPWLLAACAIHPCLWEPATRVEVYALATFGAVWTLAAAADVAECGIEGRRGRRQVLRLGVALGLTASVNPVIALAAALAIAPALASAAFARAGMRQGDGAESAAARTKRQPVRVRATLAASAIVGGLIGLMPYGYLPLVASRKHVMVWGAPHDVPSYLRYLLLRDYAHNQAIIWSAWSAHVLDWLAWAGRTGLWPILALGLIAHLIFGGRVTRASVPLAFILLLANIAANVVWHVEVPDYAGYLATPLWALAAGAIAIGLHEYKHPALRSGAILLALGCAVSAVATPPTPLVRTRSSDHLARTLANRVLREAPRGSIVISETDAVTGALFYLQAAERARPDVTVLAYGLASSSWHWEQLLRAHPDLKPVALQGPGGRAGRVRRWLAANPQRPIIIESWYTGREIGLEMCEGGLFLRAGAACDGAKQASTMATPTSAARDSAANLIAKQLDELAEGSPSVAGLLAQTSYTLGEALWRIGDAREAHAALLAGVPRSLWPVRTLSEGFVRAAAPPPSAAPMVYAKPAALGDPGRNLFLAGAIVSATGDRALATEYLRAAAKTGLPEAQRLLAREHELQRAAR